MPEHKHLFNEFGIALRKKGMFGEAIRYYHRAIELTRKDENIYLNLARAHFEKGDPGSGLRKPAASAWKSTTNTREAKSFLKYLARERLLPPGDDVMPFVRAALHLPG